MSRFWTIIAYLLSVTSAFSQQVSVNFPHFAGKEYSLSLYQGTRTDTIATGCVGADGYLEISIPDSYKAYTGVASWRMQQGGGLDIILTGTDLTVTCFEATPSDENIRYIGNDENKYLLRYHQEQEKLFRKANAIYLTLDAYRDEPDSKFKSGLRHEYEQIRVQFAEFQEKTTEDSSYAARYHRIRNFYSRIPLYQMPEVDHKDEGWALDEARRFMEEELDMEVLFTSGLWGPVISHAFDLYPDKTDFGYVMVKLLKRTNDQIVFNQLAEDLITIVEQFAWEDAETVIVDYLKESGRIQPRGIMYLAFERAKIQKGKEVPPIMEDGQPITISNPTLVIFYEKGCGNCDIQINQLIEQYTRIKEAGYDIISISADMDPGVFEESALSLPWERKLCDYEGLDGTNFRNYGVFGTPTLFLIDENGKLEGRYARLEDIKVW